jgi:hypothetical protein
VVGCRGSGQLFQPRMQRQRKAHLAVILILVLLLLQ